MSEVEIAKASVSVPVVLAVVTAAVIEWDALWCLRHLQPQRKRR